MQWGLGTLTHANTAQSLWRDGVKDYSLCETRSRSAKSQALDTKVEGVQISDVAAPGTEDKYLDPLLLAPNVPTDDATAARGLVLITLTGEEAEVA